MKKIAVFGKPGSGKSRLSKRLASITGLTLHSLDTILYHPNGELREGALYDQKHQTILNSEHWIIDGFGPLSSFYQRLNQADTLIYIDLPYWLSYWFVTKRLLKGLFTTPEGWPEGSSVIKGTANSYRTLKLCPQFWNLEFERKLEAIVQGKQQAKESKTKRLILIRSLIDMERLLRSFSTQ